MTYCFRCKKCGETIETTTRDEVTCAAGHKPVLMVRDYQAESVGVDRFALKTWGNRSTRREPEGSGEVSYL